MARLGQDVGPGQVEEDTGDWGEVLIFWLPVTTKAGVDGLHDFLLADHSCRC